MEPAGTNNARGIVLMIVAMAGFAIADTLIKSAAGRISPAQVMFLLMGGGLLVFASIALLKGQRLLDARAFAPMMVLRYLSEIISVGGMVLALSFVPLSTVGAILQATPLLVAVGAVLFLGEKVSWRRWSAIILGFFGVLLIIGPGGEEFDAAILWAVASMVCLSIRDLTTRLVPPDIPSASLASFTMIAAMPFAISWVLFNGESLFTGTGKLVHCCRHGRFRVVWLSAVDCVDPHVGHIHRFAVSLHAADLSPGHRCGGL